LFRWDTGGGKWPGCGTKRVPSRWYLNSSHQAHFCPSESELGLSSTPKHRGWGCMAASQAEPKGAACPSHQVSLGQGEGVSPLPPQPLLTFDSPRRGGQSNWGWDGESRVSVTVRPHCRGPFPFPLGRLRFCVFFLLEEMGGRSLA
uniref:Uncharacterized protein n=1 Tax=Ursus maritimus TaxID=29073 RepID=A0A452V3S7_URSMA